MDRFEEIPIQYREGRAAFMGMDILVDPRVLIPRPETELLVTVVAGLCRRETWKKPFILDVGVGSGAVSIGLTKCLNDCRIIGTDVCLEALSVARENLKRFDHKNMAELVVSDMFSAFGAEYEGVFDCVVSNPPYVSAKDYEKLDAWVKAEPKKALYAGGEGMDYLQVIAAESGRFLSPGGFVAVEIGYDQAEKVKTALLSYGFSDVAAFRDFNDHERVIVGWKHG
jgi:release factor glutamine methyltransferase